MSKYLPTSARNSSQTLIQLSNTMLVVLNFVLKLCIEARALISSSRLMAYTQGIKLKPHSGSESRFPHRPLSASNSGCNENLPRQYGDSLIYLVFIKLVVPSAALGAIAS